jgi:hypothetical protein
MVSNGILSGPHKAVTWFIGKLGITVKG